MGKLRWAIPIAILVSLGPVAADASPIDATPLRACIAAEARELGFSGAILVSEPHGVTSVSQGRVGGPASAPITAQTQFNIGSAGKMFTAVAVAQLAERGKVGLDEPIGRYVAGLAPETSAVTVRQLLDHSSGLGNYFAPQNLPALMKAKTVGDLFPLIAGERPAFAPGSKFSYSDSGFLLLGLLVEKVSGVSFGEYLRSRIFQPARMSATTLDPEAAPRRAEGLTGMRAPAELATPPAGPLRPAAEAALHGGPAGGAFSTVGDMQRFFAALRGGKLVTGTSLHGLVSQQIVAAPAKQDQPERAYGLGFGVGRINGHRWFGHNGGAPGVNAEAAVFPDENVTIVVLANRDPPVASILFRQVRNAVFEPSARGRCAP